MTTGITRLQHENKVLTRNTCIAEPRKTITTSKITTQKKLDRTLGFLRSGILRVACLSRSWFIHATPNPPPPPTPPSPPLGGYNERTIKTTRKRNLFLQGNLFCYSTNSFQFTFSFSWASSPTWTYGWLFSIGLGNIQRDQVTPSVGAQ